KRRVAVRTTLLQGRPPSGRRPGPAPGPPNMLGGGNDTTARCGGQASRQGRKSCTPERPRRSSGRHGTGRPIGGADGKRGPGGQTGVPHWRGPAAGQAGGGGAAEGGAGRAGRGGAPDGVRTGRGVHHLDADAGRGDAGGCAASV